MPALLLLAVAWLLLPHLAAPTKRPVHGPDDRPVKDDTLRIAAWNPHLGAGRDRLEGYVRDTRDCTDVWVFNEVRAMASYAALGAIAKALRLRRYQERPNPSRIASERGSTAVLTARTFETTAHRLITLTTRWLVFSVNRLRDGRRLQLVRGRKGGRPHKVVGVHGPTNGPDGGNRLAFGEFLRVLARILLTTRPGVVVSIVGDLNAHRDDLAKWIRSPALAWLHLSLDGHNVDWCITRGGTVTARRGPSKRGSDHYPVEYDVVPRPKRLAAVRRGIAARRTKKARK